MSHQLSFNLPVHTALGRGDFFVSEANAQAVAMIEAWQAWPDHKLVIHGPEGSGKSHLAHVWAALSGARLHTARSLVAADLPDLLRHPVVVEDCDRVAGQQDPEQALFHLHNLAIAEGQSVLFTARSAPRNWSLVLPDLASRMHATSTAAIAAPDDALLGALLIKLFQDRQIAPPGDLVPFLVRRIDRSFAAARDVVERLDAATLAGQRPLTRSFARAVLDKSGA